MLTSTRKALAQVGHLVVPEEVKEIEALMHAVEAGLKKKISRTQSRQHRPRQRHGRTCRFFSLTLPSKNNSAKRAC